MRLRALKEVWYGGRTRLPGDEFDCIDQDFILIHTAKDAYGGPKAEKIAEAAARSTFDASSYDAAAFKAEPEPAPAEPEQASNINPETGKRYYRRRDMTAEKP